MLTVKDDSTQGLEYHTDEPAPLEQPVISAASTDCERQECQMPLSYKEAVILPSQDSSRKSSQPASQAKMINKGVQDQITSTSAIRPKGCQASPKKRRLHEAEAEEVKEGHGNESSDLDTDPPSAADSMELTHGKKGNLPRQEDNLGKGKKQHEEGRSKEGLVQEKQQG